MPVQSKNGRPDKSVQQKIGNPENPNLVSEDKQVNSKLNAKTNRPYYTMETLQLRSPTKVQIYRSLRRVRNSVKL